MDWATLPLGQSSVIRYQARVDNTVRDGDSFTSTATLGWDTLAADGDPHERTYTDSDPETVTAQLVTTFDKQVTATSETTTGTTQHTAGVPDLAIGERVTYSLVVTLGEGTTALVVEDTLPGVLAIESVNVVLGATVTVPGGIPTATLTDTNPVDGFNDTLRLAFGDVVNAPGGADTLTVEVVALVRNVPANADGQTKTNAARLTYNGSGVLTDNVPVEIVEPQLDIQKVADVTSGLNAGDVVTYTLTVTHLPGSTADAFDARITDLIPAGMTYVPGSLANVSGAAGTLVDTGAPTLTVDWATLPLGQSSVIRYQVSLDASVVDGDTFPNTASLGWNTLAADGDPHERAYTDSDGELVSTSIVPTLTKTVLTTSEPATGDGRHVAGQPDLAIGEQVTYLLLADFQPGTTASVVVADSLPGILELVSTNIVTGANISLGSGYPAVSTGDSSPADGISDSFSINFGNVVTSAEDATGDADAIRIEVIARVRDVPANADGQTKTNTGSLTYGPGTVLTAQVSVDVVEPLLTLDKSASPALDLRPGDTLTYTLVIAHAAGSNADAQDVTLTDVIPAGLTYVPGSLSVTGGTPPALLDDSAAPTLSMGWDTLALGQSSTLTYQVTVDPATAGQRFTNIAGLTWSTLAADGDLFERVYTVQDSQDVAVNGTDLGLVKTVSDPWPSSGDTIVYTLVATNHGPNDATSVLVTDVLPVGVSYVSDDSASSGTVYDPAAGTWTIGGLSRGQSRTLNVTVRVTTTLDRVINTARIDGHEDDLNPANDTAQAIIAVDGTDLSLTKQRLGSATYVGDPVSYLITVTNDGPRQASGVVVTDLMPLAIAYASATPSQGTVSAPPATPIVWDVGVLDVGASATLRVYGRASVPGPQRNTAEITAADQPDLDSIPNNGDPAEDDQASTDGPLVSEVPPAFPTAIPETPVPVEAPTTVVPGFSLPGAFCGATCANWQVFHTDRTGDWEIFRLGDLPENPAAPANLSQGPGVADIAPSLSPNGGWIAFASSRDGNWEIYLGRTDGSEQRRVTYNTVAIDTDPAWGPGSGIVYESTRDGNWELYLLDVTTGVEQRLTDDPASDINAYWTPDGRALVFQSDRSGRWQLYRLDLATRALTLLSDGSGDDVDPVLSPSGDQIAFRAYRDGAGRGVITLMGIDGADPRPVSDPAGEAASQSWSPDGSLIAYQSDQDGDLDVYVYELSSGRTRQLTANTIADYAPTWQCGTTQVVFTSEVAGNPEIYRAEALPIDVAGILVDRDAQRLTDDPANDIYPENSPVEENASREGRLPGPVGALGLQTDFLRPDVSTTPPDWTLEREEPWLPVEVCF